MAKANSSGLSHLVVAPIIEEVVSTIDKLFDLSAAEIRDRLRRQRARSPFEGLLENPGHALEYLQLDKAVRTPSAKRRRHPYEVWAAVFPTKDASRLEPEEAEVAKADWFLKGHVVIWRAPVRRGLVIALGGLNMNLATRDRPKDFVMLPYWHLHESQDGTQSAHERSVQEDLHALGIGPAPNPRPASLRHPLPVVSMFVTVRKGRSSKRMTLDECRLLVGSFLDSEGILKKSESEQLWKALTVWMLNENQHAPIDSIKQATSCLSLVFGGVRGAEKRRKFFDLACPGSLSRYARLVVLTRTRRDKGSASARTGAEGDNGKGEESSRPDHLVEMKTLEGILREEIRRLHPEQCKVMQLCIEGLPHRQIGIRLGITEERVAELVAAARKVLKRSRALQEMR